MTGRDPSALDGRLKWFRNVGESDLQGSGQPGGGLVAELADRAVVLGCVLLVADRGDGRGAGQRQHQREDPSVPTWATPCRPRMHGLSPGHQAVDATRESPKAARTGADDTPNVDGVRPGRTRSTPARFLVAEPLDGAGEMEGDHPDACSLSWASAIATTSGSLRRKPIDASSRVLARSKNRSFLRSLSGQGQPHVCPLAERGSSVATSPCMATRAESSVARRPPRRRASSASHASVTCPLPCRLRCGTSRKSSEPSHQSWFACAAKSRNACQAAAALRSAATFMWTRSSVPCVKGQVANRSRTRVANQRCARS